MTKVRFEGPEDFLVAFDGTTIQAGVETDVSEEVAEQIKDHHGVTVLMAKTPPPTKSPTVTTVRGSQKED